MIVHPVFGTCMYLVFQCDMNLDPISSLDIGAAATVEDETHGLGTLLSLRDGSQLGKRATKIFGDFKLSSVLGFKHRKLGFKMI